MWTSTQKIKIRVHWRHTVFFSCKEVGVFFTRILSLDRKNVEIFLRYKLVIQITNQFLLHQAFTDDEASTRLLQILLFLLLSTASLMFIPCAIRSSFTLSIHFFGCLPLLLVPST